jgi:hypothetical protein
MSAAGRLLERLEGVKRTGPGRWVAKCPSHDDKNPSLSVREADDGRVLIKCWAGCSSAEITAAVGLRLADLFERPLPSVGPVPRHQRFDWRGAWRCVSSEALVAMLIAADCARSGALTSADADRAALAAERLAEAASTLNAGAPDAR